MATTKNELGMTPGQVQVCNLLEHFSKAEVIQVFEAWLEKHGKGKGGTYILAKVK